VGLARDLAPLGALPTDTLRNAIGRLIMSASARIACTTCMAAAAAASARRRLVRMISRRRLLLGKRIAATRRIARLVGIAFHQRRPKWGGATVADVSAIPAALAWLALISPRAQSCGRADRADRESHVRCGSMRAKGVMEMSGRGSWRRFATQPRVPRTQRSGVHCEAVR